MSSSTPDDDSETDNHHDAPNPHETTPLLPTTKPPIPIPPPPDGGLQAWTQVLVGHLINLNTFGLVTSFGVFQEYYTTTLHHSPAAVSWIGSVDVLLIYLLGAFTGKATDAGYFYPMLYVGLTLQLLAVVLTSLSTAYWQLLLYQGFVQGIGDGLVYCPALALVSTYFARRRTMALACVACGGATGGLIFPAIARSLLYRIGFAWTVRIMGCVMAVNAVIAVTFAKTRLPPRKIDSFVKWAEFREPAYTLFNAGVFLCLMALFFGYYYLTPFATTILHAPPQTSLNTLLILNASGLLGRLLPAHLSDTRLGPLQTLIPSALLSSLLFLLWPLVTTLPQLYLLTAGLGFTLASVQSTFPAAAAGFARGRVEDVGVRMGMCFGVVGWACVGAPPVAGGLVEWMGGKYGGAQVFGGVCMAGGAVLLGAARVVEVGWGWGRKV